MKLSEAMDTTKIQPDNRQKVIDELHDMYGNMPHEELTQHVRTMIESKKVFLADTTRSYLTNPLRTPTQKIEFKKLLRLIENLYDTQISELSRLRRSRKRS